MKFMKITFSGHSIRRMFERGIRESDVTEVILSGKIITEYPNDTPYKSCLLLGFPDGNPLHVLIGIDDKADSCYVVTAYIPNL